MIYTYGEVITQYVQLTSVISSQVVLVVKSPPANAGDIRDMGSIPGWGRSPEEEHSNPLQYSCLENPKDRGACQVTVHGVAKSETRVSDFTFISFHDT